MPKELKPDNPSSDYEAMKDHWRLVDDIMGGAKKMRAAKERYLPRLAKEPLEEYERRVKTAPFTNLYADAFRNLASKPFSKAVTLAEGADKAFDDMAKDVDRAGNNQHVFAREYFKAGVNYGIDWLLVDKTRVPGAKSRAEESAAGARPYWVRVPAKDMLAAYAAMVDGRFEIVHARFLETKTVQEGYGEKEIRRVRMLSREPIVDESGRTTGWSPARFELWEEQTKKDLGETEWVLIDYGDIGIGRIALVPFMTGEREGGHFRVRPPLRDLADMQVTEFQMEANRRQVQDMTAFPVNVIQGVAKPEGDDPIELGARTALYFPPIGDTGSYGDFRREEPSGASGTLLREDLEEFRREMREAGMQPLTPQSGNLTATATAVAEAKAHSAVEAWALGLKDALEQAWVFTALWLGMTEESAPSVNVHTDFGVGEQSVEQMGVVRDLQQDNGISMRARIEEAKRRSILGPNYDYAEDQTQILEELPGDDLADPAEAGA